MRLDDAPVLGAVIAAGPDDRVFDALVVAGPLVIGLVAVLGRSPPTVGLAAAYLATFCGYVLYNGTRGGE